MSTSVSCSLEISKGVDSDICTFHLKHIKSLKFDDVFQTDVFGMAGFKWRICAYRFITGSEMQEAFQMALLSCNMTSIKADYRIEVTNHKISTNKRTMLGDFAACPFSYACFSDFLDYEELMHPTSGFLEKGTLTASIKLTSIDCSGTVPRTCIGEDMTLINLQLIDGGSIVRQMNSKRKFGIAGLRKRGSIAMCNELVRPFVENVHYVNASSQLTASLHVQHQNQRFWLCSRTAHGGVLVKFCLHNYGLQVRFGDICEKQEERERPWTTIFIEERPAQGPFPVVNNLTFLMFIKLYDPVRHTLEYVDHVLVDCRMRTLDLFSRIADMARIPRRTECDVFVEEGKLQVRHLQKYFVSIQENGLMSGSVLILRPRVDNAVVPQQSVQEELTLLFMEGMSLSESDDDAAESAKRSTEVDTLCVVCMKAPMTSGFLHGSTSHKCVCKNCAETLASKQPSLCPVCHTPIERVIQNMH